MAGRSKRYKSIKETIQALKSYSIDEALNILKKSKKLKFDETLDIAINLGVDYDRVLERMFIMIALLVSISTALIGPITFLGLLVVNIAREFIRSYEHRYLLISSTLISVIALIGGQLLVERVINFNTTLTVIINFIGGLYFIYLLLKENKAW